MQTQKTLMLILNFTIIFCVLFSAVLLKNLYKKTKIENATAPDDKTAKKYLRFLMVILIILIVLSVIAMMLGIFSKIHIYS
jgi:ABC-type Fe3+ transport system permease subunit